MTTPITNAVRKAVRSLDRARERRATGLFRAEGTKCVLDLMAGGLRPTLLAATRQWIDEHPGLEATPQSPAEMERLSGLATPPPVVATFEMPRRDGDAPISPDAVTLALDDVQDPGNLGTIIRTAAWFGIGRIVCSAATADCWQPKVVQSTMGALASVEVGYSQNLAALLAAAPVAVCGTFLDGDNLYATRLPGTGAVIVIGNEGHGISEAVAATCTKRLTIPRRGEGAESLNAAVAAALLMARFTEG